MRTPAPAVVTLALLAGCAGNSPHVVAEATPAQRAALIDRMKPLAGTWEGTDEKGAKHVASVFAVTSNGSAIREIMLPGSEHEMINVYHMDGPSLVMTHYCAMGNQPRMRANASEKPNVIAFKADSVTNLTSADQGYMGELTITIKDNNHLTEQWRHIQKDGKAAEPMTFELTRKQ
jgi:hypothetical protein